MRLAIRLLLIGLLPLAGCSTPPAEDEGPPAFADVWASFGEESPYVYEACSDVMSGYVTDLGARGLACHVHLDTPLGTLLSRYAGPVYASGPHSLREGAFAADLLSDDFGHYNPEFVEWLVDNAIVGERDATLRTVLAPMYRARLQRLARVYWLVYADLATEGFPERTPAGAPEAYTQYLASGVVPEMARTDYYPGFTMTAFSERNQSIGEALAGPGRAEFYSALYEANTAVGFWLRRRADGTQEAFHEGLRRLLETYDAAWLSSL